MMSINIEFINEKKTRIENYSENKALLESAQKFMEESTVPKYSYNFSWLGRPIIQYPQDIVAVQELIWDVKPDLIIETGIAHGGSLILSASMMVLLEACKQIDNGQVLGIDIDIRKHNREEIEKHPLFNKITMIEGSSISDDTIKKVEEFTKAKKNIMVFLDSNHTHEHVLAELNLYAPFVSKNSYIVAFDTIIEDLPSELIIDRPWGKGNNPKTAVWEFLKNNPEFEIDKEMDNKLLITVAHNGYLKRIK